MLRSTEKKRGVQEVLVHTYPWVRWWGDSPIHHKSFQLYEDPFVRQTFRVH